MSSAKKCGHISVSCLHVNRNIAALFHRTNVRERDEAKRNQAGALRSSRVAMPSKSTEVSPLFRHLNDRNLDYNNYGHPFLFVSLTVFQNIKISVISASFIR